MAACTTKDRRRIHGHWTGNGTLVILGQLRPAFGYDATPRHPRHFCGSTVPTGSKQCTMRTSAHCWYRSYKCLQASKLGLSIFLAKWTKPRSVLHRITKKKHHKIHSATLAFTRIPSVLQRFPRRFNSFLRRQRTVQNALSELATSGGEVELHGVKL
jgi:hypothetical protein